MKHLLLSFSILFSITAHSQFFGTGSLGLAFGKTYLAGKEHNFAPQTFTFSVGAEYQTYATDALFTPHLLISGSFMLSPSPRLAAAVGLKMWHFEGLIGGADLISLNMHPLQASHWFGSVYTARVVFGDFVLSAERFDKMWIFGAGCKVLTNR